jgi:hypothetical protein
MKKLIVITFLFGLLCGFHQQIFWAGLRGYAEIRLWCLQLEYEIAEEAYKRATVYERNMESARQHFEADAVIGDSIIELQRDFEKQNEGFPELSDSERALLNDFLRDTGL